MRLRLTAPLFTCLISLLWPLIGRAAPGIGEISSSIVMVIALESPRFEMRHVGGGHQLPLALPNVRLGAGIVVSEDCLIITSKGLVENALALAVRAAHGQVGQQQSFPVGYHPAAVALSSSYADLSILVLSNKEKCNKLDLNKTLPDAQELQKLLKVGFGGQQAVYSQRLSQTPTVVTNAKVHRTRDERKVYQIDSKTSDGSAGSVVLDESGAFVGLVADRMPESDEGFVIPAATVAEFLEQALDTGIHREKFANKLDLQDVVVPLCNFADHFIESMRDGTDVAKRYFFEPVWRKRLHETLAKEKEEVLESTPASAIIYALEWNVRVWNTIVSLEQNDRPEHELACRSVVALHEKIYALRRKPAFQRSPFIQDSVRYYKQIVENAGCDMLMPEISVVIKTMLAAAEQQASKDGKSGDSAKVESASTDREKASGSYTKDSGSKAGTPTLASYSTAQSGSGTSGAASETTSTTTSGFGLSSVRPGPASDSPSSSTGATSSAGTTSNIGGTSNTQTTSLRPFITPKLYRAGIYASVGLSFADFETLGGNDLTSRLGLQLDGGILIRIYSIFRKDWLEFSLLTGLGTQWQHTDQVLHPHLDAGIRLRFGFPIGVALTTVYAPGVLLGFGTDSTRVGFSYSVLRNQLSVIFHWFTIGVTWTTDLKTATSPPAMDMGVPSLGLRAHTLGATLELLY